MSNGDIQIINKNSIKSKHKDEYSHYEYYKYQVTKQNKDSKCNVAIYEIPPNKSNYPYHYHLQTEEVFYIISGSGILETPNGNKSISSGDIIVCPPLEKGAHKIINSSENEMLVYIDFDSVSYPDITYYPHSNKVGIILSDSQNEFYSKDTKSQYYEGE